MLYPTITPAEVSFSLLVCLKFKPIHLLFVVGANCSVDFIVTYYNYSRLIGLAIFGLIWAAITMIGFSWPELLRE